MMDRRTFIAASAGLAAPFVLRSQARAADVTLRLHHFLPAGSHIHRSFLQPWASDIQAASGGRIDIQIFAPIQRAVTPPPIYDQVLAGAADIGWTTTAQNSGRFPWLEVFELPFVAARGGLANAQAIQEFADKRAAEIFAGVQPLVVWGEDAAVIHAKKQTANLDEMRGVRLCPATRLAGRALEALGAIAVTLPPPYVPDALIQNVLDGCVAHWQAAAPLRLDELTPFHTEIPGSPTLSVGVSMLVMNKARFDGMPEELRRILLEKSGQQGAAMAGRAADAPNADVVAGLQARGHTVVPVSEEEKGRWMSATQPVVDGWAAEMQGRGLDGNALLAEARALIAKYDQPPPDAGLPKAVAAEPPGAGPLPPQEAPPPPPPGTLPLPAPPPAAALPEALPGAPLPAGPLVSPPAPLVAPTVPPVQPPAPM
jgi:TRAP-type C4-dicarboxylate transport system substrate-binding protein